MIKQTRQEIGFIDFFKEIPDHRVDRRKLHSVEEILLVTFCGMIAGCDSWDDLELFGEMKLEYLRKYLPYENGIPSDDTLRRFFRVLEPERFESCFIKWVKSFQLDLAEKIVAIDGKTSRRSFDGDNKPMHLVSAFASEIGITLGQLRTAEKSNEITAIPELLDLLDIAGAVVTIDAMGCQTKIVDKITERGADYLIGLKGNQETLKEDVDTFFEKPPKKAVFRDAVEYDKGHGRIETRSCKVTDDIEWLRKRHPCWEGLNSIIEIKSKRAIKDKVSEETRYYISSLPAEPNKILHTVREHWGIENKLHWVLDVAFNDDQSRIRKGNAPRNIAIIKKTVLNMLQIIKKDMPRVSLKAMRKMAGWEHSFMDTVLKAKF